MLRWDFFALACGILVFVFTADFEGKNKPTVIITVSEQAFDLTIFDHMIGEVKNSTNLDHTMLPFFAVLNNLFEQAETIQPGADISVVVHYAPLLNHVRTAWQTLVLPAIVSCDSDCITKRGVRILLSLWRHRQWSPARAHLMSMYAPLVMPPTQTRLTFDAFLQLVVGLWPNVPPPSWRFVAVP